MAECEFYVKPACLYNHLPRPDSTRYKSKNEPFWLISSGFFHSPTRFLLGFYHKTFDPQRSKPPTFEVKSKIHNLSSFGLMLERLCLIFLYYLGIWCSWGTLAISNQRLLGWWEMKVNPYPNFWLFVLTVFLVSKPK
jgi:hypothetical protein